MIKPLEKWIILIFFLMLHYSCTSSAQNAPAKSESVTSSPYRVPDIPIEFKTPDQKVNFLMEHYWDHFNFKDSTAIKNPLIAEQAFVDFVHLLSSVPIEKATKGLSVLMIKSGTNAKMLQFFLGLGEGYLYDPNSPEHNESLYCTMLESFLSSKLIDDAWKIRPQKQYELAQKNKMGMQALDFNFTLKNGKTSSLYQIKSKYLLLFFYNPGCTDCRNLREKIMGSALMQKLQDDGLLNVLSLYPHKDLEEWNNYYSELPSDWINGYDKQTRIMNEEVYDLKTIPSLYLLNEQKIVLLKDARFEEIEAYLSKQ